jgi:hypothetical protein
MLRTFNIFRNSSTIQSCISKICRKIGPLRPKPINIKWSKSVEEQFTANLSCTNFKGIIDNISATNEKIWSGFGHDESGIVSDISK